MRSDFGEGSLNTAAFRPRHAAKKFDEAFAMLKLNEELFSGLLSGMYVFRGNISLMKAGHRGRRGRVPRGRAPRFGRTPEAKRTLAGDREETVR